MIKTILVYIKDLEKDSYSYKMIKNNSHLVKDLEKDSYSYKMIKTIRI